MFKKIGLLFRTVIHITLAQVFFLILLFFKKKILYRWKGLIQRWYELALRGSDPLKIRILNFGPLEFHKLIGSRHLFDYDEQSNTYIFTFLNDSLSCKDQVDWAPKDKTFLWRYNLHYFDYAYELGVEFLIQKDEKKYLLFKRLVTDWCENNPIRSNNGWDPYPTSLRIVNWIKAYHFFAERINEDPAFNELLLKSIYWQSLFLADNVEYHLRNNHIIENARALFLAGSFFNDQKSRRWQTRCLQILWQELRHQVHDDGGQFELSPMYHAAVMLNYIDVVLVLQALNQSVPEWANVLLGKMIRFLELMQMPDGEIAFFNDAAQGMTPATANIMDALKLLGFYRESLDYLKLIDLPQSGYFILQSADGQNKCIFDCGKLGPDYQPGHGHCDALSFVWAHQGQRVIVDSGVDDYYRQDQWRAYYRSTRAHNTIEIDGKEQSEIWGNFRVGRRAHPSGVQINSNEILPFIQGSHDGYFALSEKVLHRRTIGFFKEKILIIFDEISGKQEHAVESFLHFHPDFTFNDNEFIARGKNFDVLIFPFGTFYQSKKYHGQQNPLQGWYSPEFGTRFPNWVISIGGKLQLPAQIGYCLIPIPKTDFVEDYSCHYHLTNGNCNLEISIKGVLFHIICSAEGIMSIER